MSSPAGTGEADTVRLTRALAGHLLVAPLRVGLGVAGLVAALARGLESGPAVIAFSLGALGFAVVLLSGERYFLRVERPDPVPSGAAVASTRDTLRAAVWPSTVGVAALLVVAVAANSTLAALLGGVLAGMGITAALTAAQVYAGERAHGGRLLVDRRRKRVYVARPGD